MNETFLIKTLLKSVKKTVDKRKIGIMPVVTEGEGGNPDKITFHLFIEKNVPLQKFTFEIHKGKIIPLSNVIDNLLNFMDKKDNNVNNFKQQNLEL